MADSTSLTASASSHVRAVAVIGLLTLRPSGFAMSIPAYSGQVCSNPGAPGASERGRRSVTRSEPWWCATGSDQVGHALNESAADKMRPTVVWCSPWVRPMVVGGTPASR